MMGKAEATSRPRQLLMEELSSTEVIFSRSQSLSGCIEMEKEKPEKERTGEKKMVLYSV